MKKIKMKKTLAKWNKRNEKAVKLYRKGHLDRAVVVAKKALKLAEKRLGPDHRKTATSLNNLAFLYYSQSESAEAEQLYSRRWRSTRSPWVPIIPCWPQIWPASRNRITPKVSMRRPSRSTSVR